MERLFKGFQLLMGPVPGSLYVGVLITATIFGIAAGTVGATVVLMGIMAVPIMTKAGYDIPMSAGAITAGGTLGYPRPSERHAGRDGTGHGRLRRRALRLVLRARVPPGRHLHRLLPRPQPHQPAPGATAAARGANREHHGDRHRADDGNGAARHPHHRDARDHHLGVGDAHRGGGHGRRRRRLPGRDLRAVHVAAAQGRGLQHPAPVQHRHLPGRLRQRVRRRVLAARDGEGGHRRAARLADPAGGDAGLDHGRHLPARLALRVAGDHPGLRAR